MAGSDGMRRGFWLQNGRGLTVRETVEYAVAAEEGGFDGVFVSDSIWDGFSDPWTVLAAIAERTERIVLGTWITPVPLQVPWRLAHTLASLDQLSDGRMLLGTGLGTRHDDEMFGGTYDARALGRRYDEALEIITALWRGETVTHTGEHYSLVEARLPVLPVQQPRIPIVAGCWWPNLAPMRRGARWDGIMPTLPAMLGDQEGPEGQQPTGVPLAEEFRQLMAAYHEMTDDPGEVVVPALRDADYLAACEELGATWLLNGRADSADDLRAGPPSLS